jgi:hypothetical protein
MEIVEEYEDRTRVESVMCPWCGTNFEQRPGPNCTNCGGPLPSVAGAQRGDAPHNAPRLLPDGYKTRMIVKSNWQLHFGWVMILFGLFPLISGGKPDFIFPLIGATMIVFGIIHALKRFDILVHGQPAEGIVIQAGENTSEEANGKHPYFIKYQYNVNGKTCSGFMNCWDESSTTYREGDPIWVVYLPDGTDYRSSIWPPVA